MSESVPESANPALEAERRAERRRLRRRYRADRRFRWYGMAAITVAVVFLAYFLYDIVSRGYPAFQQHEIRATLEVTPQTVENRRQLVKNVSPELISDAAFERIQLGVQRYEFQLPVLVPQRQYLDPAEAIRQGVARRAESLLGALDEQLRQAKERGDERTATRAADQIEKVQRAAEAVAEHAPTFVDLNALERRMREVMAGEAGEAGEEASGAEASPGNEPPADEPASDASDADAPAADAAGRDGAAVRTLWVRLNKPASLQLLQNASSLNEAEKQALQQLVFFHLRRITDEGYRKVYDKAAAEALPKRQWLLAASEADLHLKGKSNRMTSAARAYEAASATLGIPPVAEPDPFEIMASAFERQRASARRYVELLESVGLPATAEPTAAAVLAAASEQRGEGRSAEAFEALIERVERAERRPPTTSRGGGGEAGVRRLGAGVAAGGGGLAGAAAAARAFPVPTAFRFVGKTNPSRGVTHRQRAAADGEQLAALARRARRRGGAERRRGAVAGDRVDLLPALALGSGGAVRRVAEVDRPPAHE